MSRAAFQAHAVQPHRFAWWYDFNSGEVVRTSDGQRWKAEDVTPLNVDGEVDVEAVDRWVLGQPGPA